MKLLLHTCCGPCFLGVWEDLVTRKDIETTLYYANPNIYPADEWEKRRDNLRIAASGKKLILIESEFVPNQYSEAIKTLDPCLLSNDKESGRNNGGERCIHCYRLRLEETAKYAKENGYDAVSTTLFVSPYQQHEKLKDVVQEIADEYGVDFYYTDWRPFFRDGQSTAKEMDLYRQKYCGCKYSISENSLL